MRKEQIELEILKLRSENAFLAGKVEAYEWFLKKKGFLDQEDKTINRFGDEV